MFNANSLMAQKKNILPLLPIDAACNLSVIIVSYNTKDLTLECVQSLVDASIGYTVEIIVVDNGSLDGSIEALKAGFPDIIVIDRPENGGFSYGNNIGLMASHSENILLLNPDTRVEKNFVEQALSTLQKFPNAGAIGPRILNADGTISQSVMRYLRLRQFALMIFIPASIMRKISLFGDFRYTGLDLNVPQNVDAISGCAILTRRKIIEDVGGLDHRIFMYSEELAWCQNVSNSKYDVIYSPDFEVTHHGGASTDHMSEWKAVEMTRGHILFFRFTRNPIIAWIATLLMFIRDALRTPLYIIKSTVGGFRIDQSTKTWWARLKFEFFSLFNPPKGQNIQLPMSVYDS